MAKNEYSEIQKEQYDKLPEKAKKDVDDGYGVVVYDLESEATICKFNMEKFRPTDEQLEKLAEFLLPEIIEFYKDEKNKKMFEEWKRKKDKKQNTQKSLRRLQSSDIFTLVGWTLDVQPTFAQNDRLFFDIIPKANIRSVLRVYFNRKDQKTIKIR